MFNTKSYMPILDVQNHCKYGGNSKLLICSNFFIITPDGDISNIMLSIPIVLCAPTNGLT